MRHFVTLVANRSATSLSARNHCARARRGGGGAADSVVTDEAADIAVTMRPTWRRCAPRWRARPSTPSRLRPRAGASRLLIADMDSTIVTGETLDELADFAGLKARIAAITARAMNGELDFKAALRERVGMLEGLPVMRWSTPGSVFASHRARENGCDDAGARRLHGAGVGRLQLFTGRVAALCGSICTGPTRCWTTARCLPALLRNTCSIGTPS